jgi:hypothetical protein
VRTTTAPGPAGTHPDTYDNFRVANTSPESLREAADLPLEEVVNAALFLLRQHISAPERELAREAGRLCGFPRTGGRVEWRMRAGIALLVQRGAASRDATAMTLQVSEHQAIPLQGCRIRNYGVL